MLMIVQLRRERYRDEPLPATQVVATRAPVWIWVVQAFLGYEWFISGLNKLLNRRFNSQLFGLLQQSTQGGPYGWYASFIRQFVLPNHTVLGVLTEIGETSIGIVLMLGAGAALFLPRGPMAWYARLAVVPMLVGSIFLSLNYFFQSGVPVPWLNTSNSLSEGVDITILIALFSAALLAANLQALAGRSAVPAPIARLTVLTEDRDMPP
jgi:thiosulfate dehydrogenase [quinone] large subunit